MSVDSIGNFLTIIRNGIMVSKPSVDATYSKMSFAIATLMKNEGFVRNVRVNENAEDGRKYIHVELKYVDGESAIHEITRMSKPSRRMYVGATTVKPVIGGLGLSILSTDRGIITHKQAKSLSVGGEILCTIW
jgi:small subunit ribosomal protein S8